jgi:hypothetical protein
MLTRFLFVLLLGMCATPLVAQEAVSPPVKTVIDQMTSFYQLTPEQAVEMEVILSRELRNVGEIASLRTNAPVDYLDRMRAIRQNTQATTRRLLDSNQRRLFQAAQQRERAEWNTAYKALQAQGLDATAIELQLTQQYLEEKGWQ